MIVRTQRSSSFGFSKTDALFVFFSATIIVVLLSLLLPALGKARGQGNRPRCIGNLKQISLAFRIFANEHDELLPFATTNLHLYGRSTATDGNGGNPLIYQNTETLEAWHIFQVMSNELASPKVLLCPADLERANYEVDHFRQDNSGATPYSDPKVGQNLETSYFVGLNASETRPYAILSGDRNLSRGAKADTGMIQGFHQMKNHPEDMNRTWYQTKDFQIHEGQGNFAMGDGSVQQVSSKKVPDVLETVRTKYGTNALTFIFPN